MARDFRKIAAWRRAHALTLRVYGVTSQFPDYERFGLVAQLRRASSSIPQLGRRMWTKFEQGTGSIHRHRNGSASEVEHQLLLARDLGYLSDQQLASLAAEAVEIRRMLIAYKTKLPAHSSQLVAHSSQLLAPSSQLTAHSSQLTAHSSLLVAHSLLA